MIFAITISFAVSLKSIITISLTVAPKTFRTPISFVLFSALNEARPNNPKQAMNIARKLNAELSFPVFCSDAYRC